MSLFLVCFCFCFFVFCFLSFVSLVTVNVGLNDYFGKIVAFLFSFFYQGKKHSY